MLHAALIGLIVAVAGQRLDGPVRIGDIATILSDAEIADAMRVAACGGAPPWLMIGSRGQIADRQFVETFCGADVVSGSVRRGTLAWVSRKVARESGWGPWSLDSTHRYAQVIEQGRGFRDISGIRDPNRPIRVQGTVADADLVQIVAFLRAGPFAVGGNERDRVEGSWPVTRVTLQSDATILAVLSKNSFESQRVVLRRTGHGWEVLSVNYVVA